MRFNRITQPGLRPIAKRHRRSARSAASDIREHVGTVDSDDPPFMPRARGIAACGRLQIACAAAAPTRRRAT